LAFRPNAFYQKHSGVNFPVTQPVVSCMKNRSITKKTESAAFPVAAQFARRILVIRGQRP